MKERQLGTGGQTLGECILADEEDAEARADSQRSADETCRRLRAHTRRLLSTMTPAEIACMEQRFGTTRIAAILAEEEE